MGRVPNAAQLVHQRVVDVQATGGVENQNVGAVRAGPFDRLARDTHGVRARNCEDRRLHLLAHDLQLLNRGGALYVAGRQNRRFSLLAQVCREFSRQRRLARALQAAKHDHGRRLRRERQRGGRRRSARFSVGELAPRQYAHQFIVNELDDLLTGV